MSPDVLPLTLLVLLGLAGLTHGVLAFTRNIRDLHVCRSTQPLWPMLVALVAGAALAVGCLFVSYPYGAARICGFPFPAATPNAFALSRELPGTLPEVDRAAGLVDPVNYPVQLGNMLFAFVLPQLALRLMLMLVRRDEEPATGPTTRPREWFDVLLFVVTGYAITVYEPGLFLIPEAWRRLPTWRSTVLDRVILLGPAMAVLLAWCVTSLWIGFGLTRPARWVWVTLLILAALGFPVSLSYLILS